MLEQIEELQLDLIEILNPIGEVLEEMEDEFIDFEYESLKYIWNTFQQLIEQTPWAFILHMCVHVLVHLRSIVFACS